jgi:hypothetical protein
MHVSRLLAVVAAVSVCACGPGVEGVFRGTTTQTPMGGAPFVSTGDLVFLSPSVQPGQVVVEVNGLGFTATQQGQALTFQANQAATRTEPGGSSSTTLTMGTGTLNGNQLSLNLSLATSQMATGGMAMPGAFTLTFTGERL